MKKLSLIVLSFMLIFLASITTVYAAAIYDHEVTFDMNGGDYVHHDIADLGSKLKANTESLTLFAIGDSTSTTTGGWFYLMGEQLGLNVPDYSVQYRLWNTGTGSYDTNTNIQYGSDGDAYALFDSSVGDNLTTMNSSNFSIVGDLDIRAKVAFEPGEDGVILSKWSTAGQYSYFLYYSVSAGGTSASIDLYWSEDGTAITSVSSGAFVVVPNEEIWIQATLDVDDGVAGYVVEFNQSDDGITWTFIDDTTTVAGVTNIFNSTSDLEIGTRNSGTLGAFDGKIFAVELRDGIAGEIVASPDLDQAFPSSVSSFKDVEGNTWIINGDLSVGHGSPGIILLNGSISGAVSSTFTANTLDNMIDRKIDMLFISLGHNEDANTTYVDQMELFVNNVLTYADNTSVVLVTQNPQIAPRTAAQILAQSIRMDQVTLLAAKNDYALSNSGAILGNDTATYIGVDGVHPTAAGYAVWADQVSDLLNYGIESTGTSEMTILVEDGELITEPDAPIKDNATFIGWYSNESLTDAWDFDTDLVQDDMTLYAKWSDSTTGSISIIGITPTSLTLLGVAWYFWAIGIAGVYYFGFTKKGRKSIGLKK